MKEKTERSEDACKSARQTEKDLCLLRGSMTPSGSLGSTAVHSTVL